MGKYHVKIIYREFQQSPDDYHATVTRLSDGSQLIWMSDWLWLLKLKIRRGALDRAFNRFDKRKAKSSIVEEFRT